MNRFIFAGDLVLLASSEQGLQHAVGWFSAAYDQAGVKISPKKTKALYLFRNPRQCAPQISGTAAGRKIQVPLDGITSDGRQNKEVATRICNANAILRELCDHKKGAFKYRKAVSF